jgi:hypothetical protein
MQTTFSNHFGHIPAQSVAPAPPLPEVNPLQSKVEISAHPIPDPIPTLTPAVPRIESMAVPTRQKHVYCVVSRLMTNTVYVSGGFERSQLASQTPNLYVVIGDTRYCIHFRSLKGGYPEYLEDPNLLRIAQDSAAKLIQRRCASASSGQV